MDTLILLLLLVMLEKDPALKDTLKGFLGFYKENRELLSAVLKQNSTAEAAPAGSPSAPPAAKKENRPEQDGSLNILEEYLKRCEI